jgi:hypothetical protein
MSATQEAAKTYAPATLMRWYANLNAWKVPEDFPLPCEAVPCTGYPASTPQFNAAMKWLRSALSEQQQSWGWWREEKLGTFPEWSAWFTEHHQARVAINEEGESA